MIYTINISTKVRNTLLWWTMPRSLMQSSTLFFRFKTHACGRWQYQSLNIRKNTMKSESIAFCLKCGGGGSRGWINMPRGLRRSFDTLFCEFNKLEYWGVRSGRSASLGTCLFYQRYLMRQWILNNESDPWLDLIVADLNRIFKLKLVWIKKNLLHFFKSFCPCIFILLSIFLHLNTFNSW